MSKVPEVLEEFRLSPNDEGVKKAMDLAGMSLKDLKGLRDMVNMPGVKNVAQDFAKKNNINLKEFLSFIDNYIAKNEGRAPRKTNPSHSDYRGSSSWRDI